MLMKTFFVLCLVTSTVLLGCSSQSDITGKVIYVYPMNGRLGKPVMKAVLDNGDIVHVKPTTQVGDLIQYTIKAKSK
jgi:hypothetical protein